jgi:hypothetical protein
MLLICQEFSRFILGFFDKKTVYRQYFSEISVADLDAICKGDRSQAVPTIVQDIIDRGKSDGWYIDNFRLCVHPNVPDETDNHGWLNFDPVFYVENILNPAVTHVISKEKYGIVD